MEVKIKATPPYERKVGRILTPSERKELEDEIARDPEGWPTVAGTGGARKARVKKTGAGKSGGPRAIYFLHVLGQVVYMLTIDEKSERDDLSPDDKKALSAVAAQIKAYEDALVEAARKKAQADNESRERRIGKGKRK